MSDFYCFCNYALQSNTMYFLVFYCFSLHIFLYSFEDTVTKKSYKCRVAFQVLIRPDSYAVSKETLGYGHKQIDSEFDNLEIEWSTKQYGATILYGLLIKAEAIGSLIAVCPYRKICHRFLKTLSLPGTYIGVCIIM